MSKPGKWAKELEGLEGEERKAKVRELQAKKAHLAYNAPRKQKPSNRWAQMTPEQKLAKAVREKKRRAKLRGAVELPAEPEKTPAQIKKARDQRRYRENKKKKAAAIAAAAAGTAVPTPHDPREAKRAKSRAYYRNWYAKKQAKAAGRAIVEAGAVTTPGSVAHVSAEMLAANLAALGAGRRGPLNGGVGAPEPIERARVRMAANIVAEALMRFLVGGGQ